MSEKTKFPAFDLLLSDLNNFILELCSDYSTGKLNSWGELDKRVKGFFTADRMAQTETLVPGWARMASYSDGITLTHVTCVFLGLFMLPEFQNLTYAQQQLAKWIVLFHDVEKAHIVGKRDPAHGFRGAAFAAKSMIRLGFTVKDEVLDFIEPWSASTCNSIVYSEKFSDYIQDNRKLPGIISGIEKLFGENTPPTLIVKGVLLHMSINVVSKYPQTAPLTASEINTYINNPLRPLLKAMMLADNEGWVLFEPEISLQQRNETLAIFEKISRENNS